MANQSEERRASARQRRERQYEIDRLTSQYADEYRAGRAPKIEAYIQRRPELAAELLEFALYFHTVGAETEALGATATTQLSTAATKALAMIQQQSDVAPASLDGLVKQGKRLGYSPRTLAEAVGLTTTLLGKLEARAIAATSIPPTLVGRFATALKVAPDAIATYLGISSRTSQTGQAAAFYYADQQPTQQQESFLDAVQGSSLTPEQKRMWAEIVDQGETPEV